MVLDEPYSKISYIIDLSVTSFMPAPSAFPSEHVGSAVGERMHPDSCPFVNHQQYKKELKLVSSYIDGKMHS